MPYNLGDQQHQWWLKVTDEEMVEREQVEFY